MHMYLILLAVKSILWRIGSKILFNMEFVRWFWQTTIGKIVMIGVPVAFSVYTYLKFF